MVGKHLYNKLVLIFPASYTSCQQGTLNGYKHLLAADDMKMKVIRPLQWLPAKKLVSL